MRITKWGEYGILCAVYLGKTENNATVGAGEIASYHSIPLQYTQQILQRLRKGGIIESVRGPGGGYRLSRQSEDISLKEILYAAEGHTFEVICGQNTIFSDCSSKQRDCDLQKVWHELKHTIDSFLDSRSLKELLESKDSELVQLSTGRKRTDAA